MGDDERVDLSRLREATAADHAEVEGLVPLMNSALGLAEYVAVLERMRGVVAAWESYAEVAAPSWMGDALRKRCRLELLDADLECLGGVAPEGMRPQMPALSGAAEMMGAMYVMEGSRLGGQMIARHVAETLHIEDGCGNAYFRGFGDSTGAMWKEFLGLLEERVADGETDDVIRGAKAMFRVFGDWMRGVEAEGGGAARCEHVERG